MGVLSQLLAANLTGTIGDSTSPDWRQYVLDHLDFITQRTKPIEIDKILINQYRYDLPRFLKESMGIQQDIAWIVLLLNSLANDMEFDKPGTYIIPTDEVIVNLYHSYTTIQSNAF